ncbi:MAG: hypothetical protein Q7S76_04585 [bacterium]|nr:hypothetical protein [bacterium]
MRSKLSFVGIAVLVLASTFCAGSTAQVKLLLPLRPRLSLRGNERILIAPFVVVKEDTQNNRSASKVDIQAEFVQYLAKNIAKRTRLQVIRPSSDMRLPTQNLIVLGQSQEYWRALGTASGAEIIISGSLEFRVEDRAGYKREEYVSPLTGKTQYREVYVEQNGSTVYIVILAFNGRTGERIFKDAFKDFHQTESYKADDTRQLFDNLFSLDGQIMNLFVTRAREAQRYLLSP